MTEEQTQTPAPAQPKKRSRTISNLTEKQVRQKREVDRKAQRAFRQRAKDCLANLEQEHHELQQNSRDTEAQLRRELEVLQRQNQRLLRCVADIVEAASTIRNEHSDAAVVSDRNGIASPLSSIGQYANISQGSVSRRSSQYEIERPNTSRTDHHASASPSPQNAALDAREVTILDPEHDTIHNGTPQRTPISSCHQQDAGNSYDRLMQLERASSDHALDSYTLPPAEALDKVHLEIGHDEGLDDGSHLQALERHGILLAATSTGQALTTYREVAPSASGDAPAFELTAYEAVPFGCSNSARAGAPPLQLLPTCNLDHIMLNFIYSRRNMLSQGTPLSSVVGPEKPAVKVLIDPSLCAAVHDFSNVLSEILSALFNVRQIEKLALFFVMYKSMRWQITRTEEDYLAMPSWLRPTVTQTTLPHAAWIDTIPWPSVRDTLIKDAPEYPIEHFVEYYAQNVSVNWEFDEDDALADITGEVLLHSIFEKHVTRLQNWSVSSEFQLLYPNLAQAIHLEVPV